MVWRNVLPPPSGYRSKTALPFFFWGGVGGALTLLVLLSPLGSFAEPDHAYSFSLYLTVLPHTPYSSILEKKTKVPPKHQYISTTSTLNPMPKDSTHHSHCCQNPKHLQQSIKEDALIHNGNTA
jgi:hypothetical protein